MLGGAALVFGVVHAMNAAAPPPPDPKKGIETAISVEREPPKPKPKPEKQERRRVQPSANRAAAPAPNLGHSIAGPSFDLARFESTELGASTDRLLGDTQTGQNQVFTADAVDEKPKALSRVEPEFPQKARQRGITGYVKLNLLITPSGEIEKAKVLESSPQGVFDESAVVAVQKWRFEPPRYNGEPVKMWFKQTVKFQLN
jgi:protein TonB